MKKKELLKVLSLAALAFAVVACDNNSNSSNPSDSNTDSSNPVKEDVVKGDIENGLFTNPVTPKEYVATKQDNRSDAYEAHGIDGTVIGSYKTIAAAINAAVDNDVEEEEFGSYVTKIGDATKLFVNHEGFRDNNDDQFWYYEDGNLLNAYNCWDGGSSILDLRNTNMITHQVSGFGTVSRQSWNSYGLLDAFGEKYNDVSAQSYELSSTMDAAVLEFTARLEGITALEYKMDLSQVKITPSYQGSDKTYAFIGYYAWQDYYVIAMGMACDTSTGNWYEYLGTSRDDSFSDVEYNLGECLMTSTWNEAGYFVPDCNEVTMSIETKKLYDKEWDEYYQVDDMKINFANGTSFERYITDSVVNDKFPGYPLGYENSYVFTAGLDIKNKRVQGAYCENTDYFNGSTFENLIVTSAKAYVPTAEEMSDVDYGFSIDSTWRGKWHDILMANSDDTDGVFDYAILNTNVCVDYKKQNNCDVFSFTYTGKAASGNTLGSGLKEYQDKIDSLGDITAQTALDRQDDIDEIAEWLAEGSTTVPQKYKNVLDFTNYYKAKQTLEDSALSPEGTAVLTSLKALETDDYEGFGAIYTGTYASLSNDDKASVRLLLGTKTFDAFVGLYTFVSELPTTGDKLVTYSSMMYIGGNSVQPKDRELTAKEAFDEMMFYAINISKACKYGEKEGYVQGNANDDNNNAGAAYMNGDNHFYPSMRIIQCREYLENDLGLTLPSYVLTLLDTIEYDDFYNGLYYPFYHTVQLAMSIEQNGYTSVSQLSTEQKAFLNEVWTVSYELSDQIEWNWDRGNRMETYFSTRCKAVIAEAGGSASKKIGDYFQEVADFLEDCGYEINDNGWGVTAETIE